MFSFLTKTTLAVSLVTIVPLSGHAEMQVLTRDSNIDTVLMNAKKNSCTSRGDLAYETMKFRQQGGKKTELLQANQAFYETSHNKDDYRQSLLMINKAYAKPISKSVLQKKEVAKEFANEYYYLCLAE